MSALGCPISRSMNRMRGALTLVRRRTLAGKAVTTLANNLQFVGI